MRRIKEEESLEAKGIISRKGREGEERKG